MTEQEKFLLKFFNEGYRAAKEGKPRLRCPYWAPSREAIAWKHGYDSVAVPVSVGDS